jgi:hypothetical protein
MRFKLKMIINHIYIYIILYENLNISSNFQFANKLFKKYLIKFCLSYSLINKFCVFEANKLNH